MKVSIISLRTMASESHVKEFWIPRKRYGCIGFTPFIFWGTVIYGCLLFDAKKETTWYMQQAIPGVA